ncbi:hypothetical protein GCM10023069_49750 [Shinella granuli]
MAESFRLGTDHRHVLHAVHVAIRAEGGPGDRLGGGDALRPLGGKAEGRKGGDKEGGEDGRKDVHQNLAFGGVSRR